MTYSDLDYNTYLERPIGVDAPEGEVSSDTMQALMESGTITSDMLAKAIISNDSFKDEIIKNINIENFSRAAKAIVSTDNTGTHGNINDAVKYVNDKGGGIVYIKAGVYKINYDIQLYTKIRIVGDGPGETILDFNNNSNYRFFLLGAAADLSLLTSYSSKAFQNVGFENISFINFASGADKFPIDLRYVRNAFVRNCFFKDCYVGIRLTSCFPFNIDNCTFTESSTTAFSDQIHITGGTNGLINNCVFNNIHAACIYLLGIAGTAAAVVVQNCNIDQAHNGIYASGCWYIKIINNHLHEILYNAITLTSYASSTNTYDCIVANNTIRNTTEGSSVGINLTGLNLIAMEDNIIVGNRIYNYGEGISLTEADKTVIAGNRVSGCATGLVIYATADRTLYDSNIIYGNVTNVVNSGSNTTAGDNITA